MDLLKRIGWKTGLLRFIILIFSIIILIWVVAFHDP